MSGQRKILFSTKLMLSYALFFSAVVLCILTAVYFILRENGRRQAELTHQILLNQSMEQLDRFFSDMDKVAYQVMTNNVLISKFSRLQEEQSPGNYFESHVLDYIDTASVLTNINGSFAPFWRISVYNNYGDFISTGTVMDPEVVHESLSQTDVRALMRLLLEKEFFILPPQKDRWSNYFRSGYLSFQRPLMNIYSQNVMGVVEIQQNVSDLLAAMRLDNAPGISLNLYDADGRRVVRQAMADDLVVAAGTLRPYGWTVELCQPPQLRGQQEKRLLLLLSTAWVASTLMMFFLVYVIARRLARPLVALTRSVQSVSVAEPRRIALRGAAIQEVEELGKAFNALLDRLIFAAEQEKQAFLLAMQAQVNPHFIYNALSVIQAMALENRGETVMQLCANLSSLLRYSSSYAEGTATMAEELEHTQAYLEIMQNRYDGLFQYSIEIAPSLRQKRVPKLVLQPLCENCFKHAFADVEPPYTVRIRIYEQAESGWAIQLCDNGAGFAPQRREQVLHTLNHAEHGDLRSMHIDGLGLISSVVRLRLYLPEQVHCSIVSPQQGGSEITISMTNRKEEEGCSE